MFRPGLHAATKFSNGRSAANPMILIFRPKDKTQGIPLKNIR